MKAYYLLAPLGVAALVAGCAYEPVYTTPPAAAPVAYVAPTPAYVVPNNTVVMGAARPSSTATATATPTTWTAGRTTRVSIETRKLNSAAFGRRSFRWGRA